MTKVNYTSYDLMPPAMANYLSYHGPHFTKKLCDFAVSMMENKDGKVKPYTKEDVDRLLKTYNVVVSNGQLYDNVYVANMCKADFFGSSISDERHLTMYIKDLIDDPDGYDGLVFNRWYADTRFKGISIDWDEML